jgi:hypothetical protein
LHGFLQFFIHPADNQHQLALLPTAASPPTCAQAFLSFLQESPMTINSVNSSLLLNATLSSSTITDSKTGNSISSSTSPWMKWSPGAKQCRQQRPHLWQAVSRRKAAPVDVSALLAKSNQQVSDFLKLLGNLVQQQGLQWNKVVSGEQKLTVDPQTKAEATQAVSEDGEMGIKNTARRILDFARLGIGNDPSKLDTIRAAVQQGFDEAKKVLAAACRKSATRHGMPSWPRWTTGRKTACPAITTTR